MSRPDSTVVRTPEDLDERITVIDILAQRLYLEFPCVIGYRSDFEIRFSGHAERGHGVFDGKVSIHIELLKMPYGLSLAEVEEYRIDIEHHGIPIQTDRIEPAIRLVRPVLHRQEGHCNLAQLRLIGLPVDPLEVFQCIRRCRIGIGRHDGIAHGPVEQGAVSDTFCPLRHAPGTGGIHIRVSLPLTARVLRIGKTVGGGDDLLPGSGLGGRGSGKGLFIEVIRLDHAIEQCVVLRSGQPIESRMPEQLIMHLISREVMTPGITVPHRILLGCIELVDKAVLIRIVNVVVDIVGRLAKPLDVVPHQAIVDGVGLKEIATAQQGQFLVKHAGLLVHEGIDKRYGRCQPELVVVAYLPILGRDTHRWILGIGERLAAEQLVEHGQPGGRKQQRLVGSIGRPTRNVQSQRPGPCQDCLVQLDKSHAFNDVFVGVQRNGPVIWPARNLDHAGVDCRALVVVEVAVARFIRVDPVEYPFDPAHRELRNVALASVRLKLRRVQRTRPLERHRVAFNATVGARGAVDIDQAPALGSCHRFFKIIRDHIPDIANSHQLVLLAIADIEELVGQHNVGSARELDRIQAQSFFIYLPPEISRRRQADAVERGHVTHPPLVVDIFRVAAEIAGVPQIDLLVEDILRLHDLDRSAVAFLADTDNMQRDRPTGVGMIVFYHRQIERCLIHLREQERMRHQSRPDAEAVDRLIYRGGRRVDWSDHAGDVAVERNIHQCVGLEVLHPGIVGRRRVTIGDRGHVGRAVRVLGRLVDLGHRVCPSAVIAGQGHHRGIVRAAEHVGLDDVGGNGRRGHVRIAPLKVVKPAAEDQLRAERVVVDPLLQRADQPLEIPARAVDHHVVGIRRGEMRGHVALRQRGLVSIQRPDHTGGIGVHIARIKGHLRRSRVEDNLGRGKSNQGRKSLVLTVLSLVLPTEMRQRLAPFQHRVAVAPVRAVTDCHRFGCAGRRFDEVIVAGKPGHGHPGIKITNAVARGVEPEVVAHGIPIPVEEPPPAGNHPGIEIAVLPEGALVQAAHADVSALVLGHHHVTDHEIQRIRRNHDVAGKARIVESVGWICRLGHRHTKRVHGGVRHGVERREQRGAAAGRVDPVGRHLPLIGLAVQVLHQYPRLRSISRIRPVNPMLQRKGRALPQVERGVPRELVLDRRGEERMLLIRVPTRLGGDRLVVDGQFRVAGRIEDQLVVPVGIDAFRAETTGDDNTLVFVLSDRGIVHVAVAQAGIRPTDIRVQQVVVVRVGLVRVLVIDHIEFFIGRESLVGIDREDRPPSARDGIPQVELRIVVCIFVDHEPGPVSRGIQLAQEARGDLRRTVGGESQQVPCHGSRGAEPNGGVRPRLGGETAVKMSAELQARHIRWGLNQHGRPDFSRTQGAAPDAEVIQLTQRTERIMQRRADHLVGDAERRDAETRVNGPNLAPVHVEGNLRRIGRIRRRPMVPAVVHAHFREVNCRRERKGDRQIVNVVGFAGAPRSRAQPEAPILG